METTSRHIGSGSNQQNVASVAFSLWEHAGRPQGRDQEFWFEAERLIAGRSTGESSRSRASSSQVLNRPSEASQSMRSQKSSEGNGRNSGESAGSVRASAAPSDKRPRVP